MGGRCPDLFPKHKDLRARAQAACGDQIDSLRASHGTVDHAVAIAEAGLTAESGEPCEHDLDAWPCHLPVPRVPLPRAQL